MPSQRELKELLKKQVEEKRKEKVAMREKLINLVHDKPAIWDRRIEEYRRKDIVKCYWDKIAIEMSLSKDKCKYLWKCLVDSFRTNFNAVTYSKSGQEFDDTIFDSIQWTFFKQLLFLKDVFVRRETRSNFSSALPKESSERSTASTSSDQSNLKDDEFLFNGQSFTFTEEIMEEMDNDIEKPNKDVQAVPETVTKTPIKRKESVKPTTSKIKKIKSDPTLLLLNSIEATNKELSKPVTTSERFGDYVVRLHQIIPDHLKLQCEMEVIHLMYKYAIDN